MVRQILIQSQVNLYYDKEQSMELWFFNVMDYQITEVEGRYRQKYVIPKSDVFNI